MDYGKYRFEQQKKEKEARKNQRVVDIKEIRLSLNIDTNDFNTKVNHAKRFLKEGNKVKASIRFRGREMAHTDLGQEVMKRFAQVMSEFAVIEKQPKLEGRSMQMFLAPLPKDKAQNKEENTMPKMKTHSGAKKRFALTKNGKVKRAKAFRSHILTKKSTKRMRGLRKPGYVTAPTRPMSRRCCPTPEAGRAE